MSTSKVDVWITETGDPCRIAKREFSVYVLECSGKVLQWCNKRYANDPNAKGKNDPPKDQKDALWMRTKCGHLEIELPPGCYVVGAVQNSAGIEPLGNHLTHIAIVRVNCDDHVCVTLFDSSLHVCGTWIGAAINTYVANPRLGLNPELVGAMQNAAVAVERMVKLLPPDPIGEATLALANVPRAK